MFSQLIIEKLGYYVYFLKDPRNEEIFYIGKGMGNRLFNHIACALETTEENIKLDRIRDIKKSGFSVQHFILRHGLAKEEYAFEIEASIIDLIGIDKLSNIQEGRYSSDFGIKKAEEIIALYEAEDFKTEYPVMLININKSYNRNMTADEIYNATSKYWVVGEKRNDAIYGIATYLGLTREVYKINKWIENPEIKRWYFEGEIAHDDIRNNMLHKSIANYFQKGAANPIRYINC